MEYIISLVIVPILFLIHIIMSHILIKNQQNEIKHLRNVLDERNTKTLAQLSTIINLKKEILELKQERD
ncbi:hypothetical protein AABD41_14985 [Staphylococcus pseudoxylosus]|uniref:hypothetical protein n=1 Tax=Staphylococcus pseudoxylosus TaxID=2282419 RepID=UPI00398BA8A7